jgi:hypothetical protein
MSDDRELALTEFGYLQDNIQRFDSNGLEIKKWAIAAWTGTLTVSAVQDASMHALAIAAVLGFAYVEVLYRTYQYRFIRRAGVVEAYLRDPDSVDYAFGLDEAAATRLPGELRFALRAPHVWVVYAGLITLTLVGWAVT